MVGNEIVSQVSSPAGSMIQLSGWKCAAAVWYTLLYSPVLVYLSPLFLLCTINSCSFKLAPMYSSLCQ